MLPLLFLAAVVAVAANDNVVAIGATLVDAVLAAATAFFAAVTAVVLSCCCLLQALLLLLLLLSLVYVLSFAAFRAPKSPPVVWCLHRFGTCTLPGPAAMSIALPIASFLSKRSHGLLRVTQACCVST